MGVATDETVALGGALVAMRLRRVVVLLVVDFVTDGTGEELLLAKRDDLVDRLVLLLTDTGVEVPPEDRPRRILQS